MSVSESHLIDNMEFMAKYPDGYFELAIVDPPYGIGLSGYSTSPKKIFGKLVKCRGSAFAVKSWDAVKPPDDYFRELFRVSRNQIIWGGNYFTSQLFESKGWVYWKKNANGFICRRGTGLDFI